MLNTLLKNIRVGILLNPSIFESLDLDEILDNRDQEPFNSDWIKCYNDIETETVMHSVSVEDQKMIEEIREESFLVVSRASSQHDIASYISDDFDLIAKSVAVNSHNVFASELLSSYRNGKIPQ